MATTYYLCPLALIAQWFNNLGFMAAGGTLLTYLGGTVSTPVTTYTDSTGLVANPNPMTLSAAGRPVSASGAPVAFWVPGGTVVKFVAFDSGGNQLDVLDNVAALDDPFGLLLTLSNSNTGFGADLVANAMRSYDVLSSVRGANVPALSGSQTLVIDLEGATLVNDGGGGLFYWSPSSTTPDDGGVTAIKPNAILPGNPGRYLRQVNLFGSLSNFVLAVSGCTTAPNVGAVAVVNGPQVNVTVLGTGNLTSNATNFGFTNWPASLRGPTQGNNSNLLPAQDNGGPVSAFVSITNAAGSNLASINILNGSGLWTATGTKSLSSFTFSYIKQ